MAQPQACTCQEHETLALKCKASNKCNFSVHSTTEVAHKDNVVCCSKKQSATTVVQSKKKSAHCPPPSFF